MKLRRKIKKGECSILEAKGQYFEEGDNQHQKNVKLENV